VVKHFDVFGKREIKYDFLWANSLDQIKFRELVIEKPFFLLLHKEFDTYNIYNTGLSVSELFPVNGVGMTTAHDGFVIDEDPAALESKFLDFKNSIPNAEELHRKFNVSKKAGWNILDGWKNIQADKEIRNYIKPVAYRPFDNRFIFYENKLVWRTVEKVMQHFLKGENVGLVLARQMKEDPGAFISKEIIAHKLFSAYDINSVFPLYLYPATTDGLFTQSARRPNLNMEIVGEIERRLGIPFVPEKGPESGVFAPVDLLDYIYAVLHSPAYREKYKEFLKIDFPRVPYPEDAATFWRMVTYGGALRALHLMESPRLDQFITTYPASGDNVVGKIRYEAGRVYINDTQYFEGVPESAWNFYIGGYQPAQKWLKDRKGRALKFEDILHYQRMVVALTETERLMAEIDGEKR
jgi:predicted helicase